MAKRWFPKQPFRNYEVKRQRDNIQFGVLHRKAEDFFTKNKISDRYSTDYTGLTLEDM